MKNQKGYTISELIILIIAIFGIYGWVMNIVAIVHTNIEPLTTMLVLRVIGIFVAPLGAVLGYF